MTSTINRDRSLDPDDILFVDSGAGAGYTTTTVEGDTIFLEEVDHLDGSKPFEVWKVIRRIAPEMLVIEVPFGGRRYREGDEVKQAHLSRGQRTMIIRQGHWLTLVGLSGTPVEEVWPASWQTILPKKKHREKRELLRIRYTALAEDIVGRPLTEDEAVSVCLAVWYATKRGLKLEVRG